MFSRNFSKKSSVTIFVAICSVFIINVSHAKAQQVSQDDLYCPIEGGVEVVVDNYHDKVVDKDLNFDVRVVNNTNFVIADNSIVVALYSAEDDTVPVYWAKTPQKILLLPKKEVLAKIDFRLDYLPKGEYIMRFISVQGNDVNSLGEVLKKGGEVQGIKLIKTTPADKDLDLSLSINKNNSQDEIVKIAEFSDIEVGVTVNNNNTNDVITGGIVGVVSQGDVPLGSALFANKTDRFKIIPGDKKRFNFHNPKTTPGAYKIYTGLISPNFIYPIKSLSLEVGDGKGPDSWSYLSKIGFSDYPLNKDSKVVACINYIGKYQNSGHIYEMLALDLEMKNASGTLFKEKIYNSDTDANDYFSFFPKIDSNKFDFKFDLLQQRYQVVETKMESGETIDNSRDSLSVVSSLDGGFECFGSEYCVNKNESSVSQYYDYIKNNSPWFYISIIVVALLILLLAFMKRDELFSAKNLK